MTPEMKKIIHTVWGVITAVLLFVTAACLIISCIRICQSGARPFRLDVVKDALHRLCIPGSLCLVAICGGCVLHLFLPLQSQRTKITRQKCTGNTANLSPKRLLLLRCGVLALALLLIALGIINTGYADVLGKAIRICQECIGIG